MDLTCCQWLNPALMELREDTVIIRTPGGTDFFNSPVPEGDAYPAPQVNAPFFHQKVKGDFVFQAKVCPSHQALFDAAGLLVYQHELLWVKCCLELTETGDKRLVSGVTEILTDDANGPALEESQVWLRVCRKGNLLGIYYSVDGSRFQRLRVCSLPFHQEVMVGLEAQCPRGEGAVHTFSEIRLEKVSIEQIWSGY